MITRWILAGIVVAGAVALDPPRSQTQMAMNDESCATFEAADKEMNDLYQSLLARSTTDSGLTMRLRVSQQAWVRFRDAQIDALFGAPDNLAEYGSVWWSDPRFDWTPFGPRMRARKVGRDGRVQAEI